MTVGTRPPIMFNQAQGPLLRDFLAALTGSGAACILYTGRDWKHHGDFAAGVRVETGPSLNRKSASGRFVSWFAYSVTAATRLLRCDRKQTVVLFSNPPLLPIVGWLCSLFRGYSYSVVVYDIYPDVMAGMGVMSEAHVISRLWRTLNRRAYEHAFAVLTLGDVMAASLAKQFSPLKTSAGRILVARPWVDSNVIRPRLKTENLFAAEHGQLGKTTVLYSGNVGATHDMATILVAARLLNGQSGIEFLLIGSGSGFAALQKEAKELPNVRVLPWQAAEQLPNIWATAEIALITLRAGIEQSSFPSKTPFALSAGCALIGITQTPSDLAEIIAAKDCGVVISPGDAHGLASAINALANDPTRLQACRTNSRRAAIDMFGPERNLNAMLQGMPDYAQWEARG